MFDVNEKVVFITGGAKGLGKAYSEALLEKGAKICFGDVNAELGKATESELAARYGSDKVLFIAFDVTKRDQFEEAFAKAISRFERVDVMVNNAGVLNEGTWELMIQINYTGTITGTKLAFEHMRTDKGGRGGRIINISSIVGLVEHFTQPVYCGTKHAVRAFTLSIAMEPNLVSTTGVELACLSPDAAETDLITKLDNTRFFKFDLMKDKVDERMMPVPTVVSAFIELLQLDSMNGANLMVTKNHRGFQKMDKIDLGKTWPPAKPST